MTLEDETVRDLRALLEKAAHEPHTITLLTDEELVAVESGEASTPYPTPWINQTQGVDRNLAGQFGVRSLLARGLLRTTEPEPGTTAFLDVPSEVRIVLDTRRVGLGYIRATRPEGDAGASKIIVIQPELGAFEEDISIQGFHLFTVCNYDDATSRLARWCLPPATYQAHGGATHIAAAEWPAFLHAELPNATVVDLNIEVYLPDRNGNREPDQWIVAFDDTIAMVAQRASAQQLVVRPITMDRLRGLLDDRVALALQYARSGGSHGE